MLDEYVCSMNMCARYVLDVCSIVCYVCTPGMVLGGDDDRMGRFGLAVHG